MKLSIRQKLAIIPLLLYWPAIFILTHMSPRTVSRWVYRFRLSDKMMHFLAYFVLAFLLWFVISPEKKVRLRRATTWWVLLIVAVYGVIDEVLQHYVSRSPDVFDFLADLAGAASALIVLAIFPFYPAALTLAATAIFVITNFMELAGDTSKGLIDIIFHLGSYGFFTLLWARYMFHIFPVRPPQIKWFFGALFVPVIFMLGVESFQVVAGNGFSLSPVLISLAAIFASVIATGLAALIYDRFRDKPATGYPERTV